MGSQNSRFRDRPSSPLRCSHNHNARPFTSTLARFFLFKRIHYFHLLSSVAVFFSFLFLFQIFLPPDHHKPIKPHPQFPDLSFLKHLDFADDFSFELLTVEAKFQKYVDYDSFQTGASTNLTRFGLRKPALALVFADLLVDPHQIQMLTIAKSLREIGYEIEVLSFEDGPVHDVWRDAVFPVHVIRANENVKFNIDWLNYDGILLSSLKAVGVLFSLMQDPFKNLPLVWTISEKELIDQLNQYVSRNQSKLVDNWRKVFRRATAVVFQNYFLPMAYSNCDPGNYVVIPGHPAEAWKADKLMASQIDNPLQKMDNGKDDFVIAIVGSHLLYRGQWLEHALLLQALYPLLQDFRNSASHLNIIILAGDYMSNYSRVVETIALKLMYPSETVKHVAVGEDADVILGAADLVIYGSFLDEPIFPDILVKAMCLGIPVIAPDLPMIVKYISDKENGYVFSKEEPGVLTDLMFQLVSNGRLSFAASDVGSVGRHAAHNFMVSESVEGYASLLENILILPSEVSLLRTADDIPSDLKAEWQWHSFKDLLDDADFTNKTQRVYTLLGNVEKQFSHTEKEHSLILDKVKDTFVYGIWEEQIYGDIVRLRKKREEEELTGRTDQPLGVWDEIYKNARRSSRILQERDDEELERTGQPLCIYEPYFGKGTWPFLHNTSLYRGIGLSASDRRPTTDDIDAASRLPLLNDSYYRDILGDYGAFFAIANRIDYIHKSAWVGFQSWRATARKISLSRIAERSLVDAIEARKHGDTLYFWATLDMDPRNQLKQDFWSFCDAVNAGNCKCVFLETIKTMYGIKVNLTSVPAMPSNGGTWSVMHGWALPTKSFLEFVMFSRMFVDALDTQYYDVHHKTGRCCLSLNEEKQCYSRMLELVINVWAYHSARRMVYINPRTGYMQEQHKMRGRRGLMWIKWMEGSKVKTMDEELAEEFDDGDEGGRGRWLWPYTGEVFWEGMHEKERNLRNKEKEMKKQEKKEKIERMKKRARQKAISQSSD